MVMCRLGAEHGHCRHGKFFLCSVFATPKTLRLNRSLCFIVALTKPPATAYERPVDLQNARWEEFASKTHKIVTYNCVPWPSVNVCGMLVCSARKRFPSLVIAFFLLVLCGHADEMLTGDPTCQSLEYVNPSQKTPTGLNSTGVFFVAKLSCKSVSCLSLILKHGM